MSTGPGVCVCVCVNRNSLASDCYCFPGCKARIVWWAGTKVWAKPLSLSSSLLLWRWRQQDLSKHLSTKKHGARFRKSNCKKQSTLWQACSSSASQEIPLILRNPEVHYHDNNSPLPVPVLSQINPVHAHQSYFFKIRSILSSHLLALFQVVTFSYNFNSMRSTCSAHLIVLRFITLIIFGEECWSWISPVCNFLQPPVTFSLLGPNILLSTLFSNTLSPLSSLSVSDQVSRLCKAIGRTIILHILSFSRFSQNFEKQLLTPWRLSARPHGTITWLYNAGQKRRHLRAGWGELPLDGQ